MSDSINILLIEDNPGDARLILELLTEAKGLSSSLTCVGQLSSGIQQISRGAVDIVLLDLSLPDSKGYDTFRKLHAQAKGLPIIVLTGLEDGELALRAVRAGAQNYMVKGALTAQCLACAVNLAIERRNAESADAI